MQLPVPKWESARHRSLADILSPASGTATASDIMHPNLASQTDRIDGKSIKWGTIDRTESIKRCLSSAPARTRAFATPSLTRSVWLNAGSRRCRRSPWAGNRHPRAQGSHRPGNRYPRRWPDEIGGCAVSSLPGSLLAGSWSRAIHCERASYCAEMPGRRRWTWVGEGNCKAEMERFRHDNVHFFSQNTDLQTARPATLSRCAAPSLRMRVRRRTLGAAGWEPRE